MSTAPDSVPLRCSTFARVADVDPVGTAGSYDTFVLVEHPLPWPRDVADDPLLRDLAAAAGSRARVQALVPQQGDATTRTVIVYRRPPGPFSSYLRSEAEAEAGEVAAAVAELARSQGQEASGQDVLICTHGRRDVCCGSLGTELFTAVTAAPSPDVRWWRTSHTGGHRFAPTAITFPSGQYWAYLDASMLERIAAREGELAPLSSHYRGSAAMPSPAVQAVEREAFVRHGWDWLGYERQGWEEAGAGDDVTAVVTFAAPGGERGSYRGTVAVNRVLPVPDCGKPIEEAGKSEAELKVTSFVRES